MNLDQDQKKILGMLNKTRLELIKQMQGNNDPNAQKIFQSLLALQVLLMQNKSTNNLVDLLHQNSANLMVLVKELLVNTESDKQKKFNIKWKKDPDHIKITQNREDIARKRPQKQKQIHFEKDVIEPQKKVTIQPGQFVSASILPKGTSVRKKFVPPFKKPQAPQKYMDDKDEQNENCKQPAFKNLQQKLVSVIMSQILQKNQEVKWSSIAGLGFAKTIIHQMIVWPMQRPDIFTGMRAPPRAILLFGPPGTGKTMIGRAIASEASATFFSISASSLTSKWVGESQKLVKTLFAIARAKQPSVIFIDEIDSLLCARSEGEQQSSRRVKTEFLVELDGAKTNSNQRVLIIGATNLPRQLDDAVRRRFVKRLYIPLPNQEGRIQLIQSLTNNNAFAMSQQDIKTMAHKTKGFSGADLYTLCSEASMIPLRQVVSIEQIRNSEVPVSKLCHFESALRLVRPSVNKKMLKSFQQFNQQYGSYQFTPDELEEEE